MTPAAAARPERPGLISAAALMALRTLELRARAVVDGDWSGRHRNPLPGFSTEFTEYRPYTPGDDLRYLDWRALARSDRYYLKKFEDETNLRCHLVVDQSRSMQFASLAYPKSGYAATLAATLACFLRRQGDAVGLLTFGETVRAWLPARRRADHLRRLFLALEAAPAGTGTDLGAPLERLAQLLRHRGLVVFISDFLAPVDQLARQIGLLTAAGQEVSVLQVLDPAEVHFTFARPAVFRDAESGREFFVDPAAARAEYLGKLAAHEQQLRAACARLGADFARVVTDEPMELVLSRFVRLRVRRAGAARPRQVA